MVLSSEVTGFLASRLWASINDDEPASPVKRLERPVQNGPGMQKFVVSVRHKDRIDLPFWQMRVVRVTVNNVNVALMAQACSDS